MKVPLPPPGTAELVFGASGSHARRGLDIRGRGLIRCPSRLSHGVEEDYNGGLDQGRLHRRFPL